MGTPCGDVNKRQQRFLFLSNIDMVLRNSTPGEFNYIWQSKCVGIISIKILKKRTYFWSDVFEIRNPYEVCLSRKLYTRATKLLPLKSKKVYSILFYSILFLKTLVRWLNHLRTVYMARDLFRGNARSSNGNLWILLFADDWIELKSISPSVHNLQKSLRRGSWMGVSLRKLIFKNV